MHRLLCHSPPASPLLRLQLTALTNTNINQIGLSFKTARRAYRTVPVEKTPVGVNTKGSWSRKGRGCESRSSADISAPCRQGALLRAMDRMSQVERKKKKMNSNFVTGSGRCLSIAQFNVCRFQCLGGKETRLRWFQCSWCG